MKKNLKIGVIGLWHLGSVYSASLARMGADVVGFDFDTSTIENLQKGIPPIFEPELEDTIEKYRKTLRYSDKIEEIFHKVNYLFITFDLPVDDSDRVDLELIDKTFPLIAQYIEPQSVVVISSQVPVGTSRRLVQMLRKKKKINQVMYFPENLRLGTAFDAFLKPDRIILGADDQKVVKEFEKDFGFTCPIIGMKLESAEMVKHALNTYLATCISFSSELSDISELIGADMREVVAGLKSDSRVSPKAPLNPGLGFAGGTLGRDIRSLQALGKSIQYKTKLMDAIYKVNNDRLPYLVQKIENKLKTLTGKNICILGLTYKPNTNTLRRSMSLGLAELLHQKKVKIHAYDPVIINQIPHYEYLQIHLSPELAVSKADAVILMTEWDEFKKIDPKKILMKKKILFDTKNFLNAEAFEKAGFTVIGTGY